MKRIFLLSGILTASALLLSSCNDFLDHLPDNRAELDTEEKISKMLISAYPLNSFAFMCEMASDNTDSNGPDFTATGAFQEEVFKWADLTDARTNDGPYRIWENTYKAVASANQALQAIEEMGSPASLNPQKGEALMCRAFGHFILSYVFCKPYSSTAATDLGLPYLMEPETEVFGNYDRGTLEKLYKNISDDIEAGLPLIDDRAYTVPKYHFNRKAAYAFAVRFNLYYRQYGKAIAYSKEVLGAEPAKMLRDWAAWGALSQNGSVAGDAYVDASNKANLLMYTCYSNWGRTHSPSSFVNDGRRYTHNRTIANAETVFSDGPWGEYKPSDSPYYYNIWWTDASRKVCMRKINEYFQTTNITATGSSGYAWTITTQFTTDLVLLEKAEANALAGNLDDAVADLTVFMSNFLRGTPPTRQEITDYYEGIEYYTPTAPTPKKRFNTDMPIAAGDQENILHCILHLKRILTIHEGLRWNDINRYGIEVWRRQVDADGTITVMDKLEVNDNRRVFQLPEEVVASGLKANPR